MTDVLAQPDLFGPNFTSIPVGRPSQLNSRCLKSEDCHSEKYQCGGRAFFEISIGRTGDGYVYSHGCQYGSGGWIGPVFACTEKLPSFFAARQQALDDLAMRLSTFKSEGKSDLVAHARAAILKKIGDIR
jgi:hypothetical protein